MYYHFARSNHSVHLLRPVIQPWNHGRIDYVWQWKITIFFPDFSNAQTDLHLYCLCIIQTGFLAEWLILFRTTRYCKIEQCHIFELLINFVIDCHDAMTRQVFSANECKRYLLVCRILNVFSTLKYVIVYTVRVRSSLGSSVASTWKCLSLLKNIVYFDPLCIIRQEIAYLLSTHSFARVYSNVIYKWRRQ